MSILIRTEKANVYKHRKTLSQSQSVRLSWHVLPAATLLNPDTIIQEMIVGRSLSSRSQVCRRAKQILQKNAAKITAAASSRPTTHLSNMQKKNAQTKKICTNNHGVYF